MSIQAPPCSTLYTGLNMSDGEQSVFSHGSAIVFSSRSPDKESINEDAAAIIPYGDEALVLVVADGVGGHPAGAHASATVLKALVKTIGLAAAGNTELREAILSGIEEGNKILMADGNGAATTLAIVEIQKEGLRPYHVGDSMILITGQRGKVKLETVSHSPVGYAIESGILTENDAFNHEDRHIVSNVVGSPDMHVSIGTQISLDKRDTLLIATDGLFDNLQKEEIIGLIRKGPLPNCSQALIQLAHARMQGDMHPYKPDDMTFIIFRQ